jgi:chromosomal replication initiator protein
LPEFSDYRALWNEAMTRIKAEIGEQSFNWWFNIEYIEFSEGNITVSALSSFHRDNLIQRYLRTIESTIQELAGKHIPVIIKAQDESKKSQQNSLKNNAIQTENTLIQESKRMPDKNITQEKITKKTTSPQLSKEFTFENYVVGDNNQFAVNAAMAVSKNPGSAYNPLFIYSRVGLGKTHLLQAIGNYIYQNSENKIIYTTAESFLNEFVELMISKENPAYFKKKYRSSDLLLIDDIHFLENKSGCQEELFNTFNALISSKKQMVFTCDRPVSELKNFTERLSSRLGSGLHIDIQIPQYEMRCAILRKKIAERKAVIPDVIIDLICKNISTNVRDIVAALNKLIGYAELIGRPITLAVAQEQLQDIFTSPKQSNISIDNIQHAVADYFSLSINDLKGKKRTRNIVHPRQLSMYVIKNITEFTTTDIGQSFGGRDHTTVLHSLKAIEERLQSDPTEDRLIQDLIKAVKEYSVK